MKYRKINYNTCIEVNTSVQDERIEVVVKKAMTSNSPIGRVVTPAYTERKDGVLPQYNIRTDKWDLAQEAMGKVEKTYKTQRLERLEANKNGKKDGKPEPTQATE